MKWLDGITNSMDMSLCTLWEIVKGREAGHSAIHWVGHELLTEPQQQEKKQIKNNCLFHSKWDYKIKLQNVPRTQMLKRTSLVAQTVKNLPAMQKTRIQSLSPEDSLEKGMATHSSIFAWRIPRPEKPGRLYSPWYCKDSDTT